MTAEILDGARAFQASVDELGAGRPAPQPSIRYHPTGMAATLVVEVAVVRSHHPRKCSVCGRKRVLYALTFTDRPVGNVEAPWRCGADSGLREEGAVRRRPALVGASEL